MIHVFYIYIYIFIINISFKFSNELILYRKIIRHRIMFSLNYLSNAFKIKVYLHKPF